MRVVVGAKQRQWSLIVRGRGRSHDEAEGGGGGEGGSGGGGGGEVAYVNGSLCAQNPAVSTCAFMRRPGHSDSVSLSVQSDFEVHH